MTNPHASFPETLTAAHELAAAIRDEADKLGTAPIDATNRRRVKVLGSLPPQTFGQGP